MRLPITIGLNRSSWQAAVLLALELLASLAVLFFQRPLLLQMVLLLAIWVIALLAWRRLAPPVAALRLEVDGTIQTSADGQSYLPASLLPEATVHPWLTVLRLELADGRRHALLVTKDSLNPDDFRRLRVFLRWRASFGHPDRP